MPQSFGKLNLLACDTILTNSIYRQKVKGRDTTLTAI